MYLVVIAWLYVAVMMALAEAFSGTGTVLGAIVTFFLYGLLPISLVVYLMGTPLRRKARLAAEQAAHDPDPDPSAEPLPTDEQAPTPSTPPDRSGHTAG
jgi:hypothetical protein